MDKGFEFHTTHNGRLRISTFSFWRSWKVSLLLMLRYGFHRKGTYIPPVTDQAIHPSYYRGKMIILSGWDNWFGYDWLADNEETDSFLKVFIEKHCRNKDHT
ncbi:MAG: hypothetical protein ABIK92_01835 [Pseudomonadota bacterium]